MIQHLETECENVFRNLKHWRKVSNFQKFANVRHSGKRVSIGMCHKTTADVDDGLEIELQHAESTHTLVLIQIPEFMPQFQDELLLDQFFKVILNSSWALMELTFRFHPRQRQIVPLGN